MANLIHAFSLENSMLDEIQKFLEPISIEVNELKGTFTVDIKEHDTIKHKHLTVIIKTSDGTVIKHKRKFRKNPTVNFVSMTEEEALAIAQMQGIALPSDEGELMPAIGFAVPTEDDYEDEWDDE